MRSREPTILNPNPEKSCLIRQEVENFAPQPEIKMDTREKIRFLSQAVLCAVVYFAILALPYELAAL